MLQSRWLTRLIYCDWGFILLLLFLVEGVSRYKKAAIRVFFSSKLLHLEGLALFFSRQRGFIMKSEVGPSELGSTMPVSPVNE